MHERILARARAIGLQRGDQVATSRPARPGSPNLGRRRDGR